MEQVYARALWKMIGSGMKPAVAVKKLRESLAAHGRLALLPKIAHAFERTAAREHAKQMLTVSIAKGGATHAMKEAGELLKAMHIDSDDVETRTDENLIGGWRLEGREHLFDASYKRFLLDIYHRVIQS